MGTQIKLSNWISVVWLVGTLRWIVQVAGWLEAEFFDGGGGDRCQEKLGTTFANSVQFMKVDQRLIAPR